MGNWYTNVAVKGAEQAQVVATLEELGRRAYVTPETAGWIVVYDQQTDEFDLGILESLALTLSTRLSCTTLASCNADDDVLWLALYEKGSLLTRYASSRKAFEDGNEFPDPKETAQVLAREGSFRATNYCKRNCRVTVKCMGTALPSSAAG